MDNQSLSDAEVARLLPVLATRARATEGSVDSFRPPQVGIVEQVMSSWHHLVVGRRGVGKSMLLLTVASSARANRQPVAYIDLETLRDNPYPDVLIRLLIEIVASLDRTLRGIRPTPTYLARRAARKGLRRLLSRLDVLLRDPQEATHRLSETGRRSRGRSAAGSAAAGGSASASASGSGSARLEAGAAFADASESNSERQAEFVRTKLEGLRAETIEFRQVLKAAIDAAGSGGAFVILDDFYFVRREDQPDVLSYLHSVVKNVGIWLKVGAVEHRLNEFEDGNPPRGLQLNQDAGKIAMDVTLADFPHTKQFLEAIFRDACAAGGVDFGRVVTDVARTRLVMASGGVPRDYLNLAQAALAKSSRRVGEPNRPKNKITAEDVTQAAPDFLKQKEDDLRLDATPEDVTRLRRRLEEVLNYCLNVRHVNVFLTEARLLREEEWGRDIAALSDLRFFHKIGNLTVKSSDPAYVGRRYEAFALDLSSYASTRVRGTHEVEFWTTDGFQRLRASIHVYTPEIAKAAEASAKKAAPAVQAQAEGQRSIFDVIDDVENEATDPPPDTR